LSRYITLLLLHFLLFNDTAPTEIYALSLHDALPISTVRLPDAGEFRIDHGAVVIAAITSCTNTSNPAVMMAAGLLAKKAVERGLDRKSTRLNSSHVKISYAVFCLKKKI